MSTAEPTLALGKEAVFQMGDQAVEEHMCKQLASDEEQRDAAVVVAVFSVSLSLVEMDDCGIFELLGELAFIPQGAEEVQDGEV